MFKFLKEKKKDNKGFTLVELVVVIAILAILVGLLAPQYTKYVEKSRKSADVNNMDELVKAVQVYAVDNAVVQTVTTATTITIQLTDKGVKGATSAGEGATPANIDDNSVEGKAFKEYVPNWKKIVRKSAQWGTDTKGANPTVTLEIDADGGVKVTSTTPSDFETYSK